MMLVLLLIESVSNSSQDDECVVSGSTAILDSSLLFTCVGMDLLKDLQSSEHCKIAWELYSCLLDGPTLADSCTKVLCFWWNVEYIVFQLSDQCSV